MWKVYKIELKPWQSFILYKKNGIAKLTTDEKDPMGHCSCFWSKEKSYYTLPDKRGDRYAIPTWIVINKNELLDNIRIELKTMYQLYSNDKESINHNIIILTKEHEDGIEIGYCLLGCKGEHEYVEMTEYLEKIHNLNIFI